jgi:hypothetical protein
MEGIMDWTDLDQERNRWRALVNVIMNLRVPNMRGMGASCTGLIWIRKGTGGGLL